MSDPTDGEEVLRGAAAPRTVPVREGQDPSNTPVEDITEDVDDDDLTLVRLAQVWAEPDTAEDAVRRSAGNDTQGQ